MDNEEYAFWTLFEPETPNHDTSSCNICIHKEMVPGNTEAMSTTGNMPFAPTAPPFNRTLNSAPVTDQFYGAPQPLCDSFQDHNMLTPAGPSWSSEWGVQGIHPLPATIQYRPWILVDAQPPATIQYAPVQETPTPQIQFCENYESTPVSSSAALYSTWMPTPEQPVKFEYVTNPVHIDVSAAIDTANTATLTILSLDPPALLINYQQGAPSAAMPCPEVQAPPTDELSPSEAGQSASVSHTPPRKPSLIRSALMPKTERKAENKVARRSITKKRVYRKKPKVSNKLTHPDDSDLIDVVVMAGIDVDDERKIMMDDVMYKRKRSK